MKNIFKVLAGIGFMTMMFGGMMMNEPNLIAFLIAFGGLGVFAGGSYVTDYIEWLEERRVNE